MKLIGIVVLVAAIAYSLPFTIGFVYYFSPLNKPYVETQEQKDKIDKEFQRYIKEVCPQNPQREFCQ